jgi:ABC-type methionine transport system ATPase subunit
VEQKKEVWGMRGRRKAGHQIEMMQQKDKELSERTVESTIFLMLLLKSRKRKEKEIKVKIKEGYIYEDLSGS